MTFQSVKYLKEDGDFPSPIYPPCGRGARGLRKLCTVLKDGRYITTTTENLEYVDYLQVYVTFLSLELQEGHIFGH